MDNEEALEHILGRLNFHAEVAGSFLSASTDLINSHILLLDLGGRLWCIV